jgi:phage pi2 protein 07
MSDLVKQYMRLVAAGHIEDTDDDEYQEIVDKRDDVWYAMNLQERDEANQLVEDIFGEYI